MSKFNLIWGNTSLISNANVTAQRVSYKPKAAADWITAGFSLPNDLAKNVTSVDSPELGDNIVYQFRVQALCSLNGPVLNDNGVQEQIQFVCIAPTITKPTWDSVQAVVDVTGLDITKAFFQLRRANDSTLISSGMVNRGGNSIIFNQAGGVLQANTNYYLQISLYATLNNTELSSETLLGAACGPYPVSITSQPVCNPLTSVDAVAEAVQ